MRQVGRPLAKRLPAMRRRALGIEGPIAHRWFTYDELDAGAQQRWMQAVAKTMRPGAKGFTVSIDEPGRPDGAHLTVRPEP